MFLDKTITPHKSTPLHCQDQHHQNTQLQVRSTSGCRSVFLQDLMPRYPPLGNAAAHKMCWWLSILSMYSVIEQGFFLFVCVLSERCNRSTGREQNVLFRHFYNFPIVFQLQSSVVCMHEQSWAQHLTVPWSPPLHFSLRLQKSERMPRFGILKVWHFVLATCSPQLLGKT